MSASLHLTPSVCALASTATLQARLQECLDEADTEGQRTADRQAAPVGGSAATLDAVRDSGLLVDRFLIDVRELLGQVLVAGLAYPDPELADELGDIVGRAQRLGLPTAVRGLLRLRAFLLVLAEERDDGARHRLAAEAWHQTQRLVAWLRLLRLEHDYNTVQARLSEQATDHAHAQQRRDVETVTVSIWPVGLELSGRGRAVIHARDLDDERDFVLLDELTDLDANSPMTSTCISRLLQSQVVLRDLMRCVIRLDQHPALDRDGVTVIRPAFTARPALLPVAANFSPPRPPVHSAIEDASATVATLDLAPTDTPHCLRTAATVRRRGRMVRLVAASTIASVHVSSLLEFNLIKLLVREATPTVSVELTVLAGEEPLPILALETEFDGAVFPMFEPTCFVLSATVLARRALHDAIEASTPEGHWLRTGAVLFGGASDDAVQRLRNASASLPDAGLVDAWRSAFSRFLLTSCPDDPRVAALVSSTLELATADTTTIDLDALARVLGQDAASPGDLERLDGTHRFAAVWLALESGLAADLLGQLLALYEAHYNTPGDEDPAVGDICARALLMAVLGIGSDDSAGAASFDVDAVDGEAEDDSPEISIRSEGARHYLDAHVDAIVKRTRKRRAPLPSLFDLLLLGDTYARLHGHPRHAATLAALGLPVDRIRRTCADALARWTFDNRDQPGLRQEAGDALLVTLAAAIRPQLVGPA